MKGYVLKMNPETGKVEKATVRTDGGIGGFFGVYEGAEKLYAFGYDFSGGAIVAPINKNTYALRLQFKFVTMVLSVMQPPLSLMVRIL